MPGMDRLESNLVRCARKLEEALAPSYTVATVDTGEGVDAGQQPRHVIRIQERQDGLVLMPGVVRSQADDDDAVDVASQIILGDFIPPGADMRLFFLVCAEKTEIWRLDYFADSGGIETTPQHADGNLSALRDYLEFNKQTMIQRRALATQ